MYSSRLPKRKPVSDPVHSGGPMKGNVRYGVMGSYTSVPLFGCECATWFLGLRSILVLVGLSSWTETHMDPQNHDEIQNQNPKIP